MQLSELFTDITGQLINMCDSEITHVTFDSRKVRQGSLFIAVKGSRFDGHKFIADVVKKGAVAVVTQRRVDTPIPQLVVKDTRAAMSKLARKFYGEFPDMQKVGITGTNGKTTTAYLVHSILHRARMRPGLIGTVFYIIGSKSIKAERTTPESLDIFELLYLNQEAGAGAVVMEVSSHALSLGRVSDLVLNVAVFTNLSQDHLDFHGDMKVYEQAKLRIFSLLTPEGYAVFNLDEEVAQSILTLRLAHTLTYGIMQKGDIWARIIKDTLDGLEVEIHWQEQIFHLSSKLIGTFNAYNFLAAFATGLALNIEPPLIVAGLEDVSAIPGRMERVIDGIFVDYAHTPAAIENALHGLRKYAKGRLIIVFGCGGDRDRDKRPKMGAIASSLADYVILTSDNPRSESPSTIIKEIQAGIATHDYEVVEDRREAIAHALSLRSEKDVILVAGKGHEDYQIIGEKKIHFDDAEVIRECFTNIC